MPRPPSSSRGPRRPGSRPPGRPPAFREERGGGDKQRRGERPEGGKPPQREERGGSARPRRLRADRAERGKPTSREERSGSARPRRTREERVEEGRQAPREERNGARKPRPPREERSDSPARPRQAVRKGRPESGPARAAPPAAGRKPRPERKRPTTRVRADGSAAAERSPTHSEGEPQRIAKLLARAGIGSRREIERMIADRRIAIDNVPVETPATILTSLKGVTVDGKPVRPAAETRLFLFHKPAGLLTAERDFSGRPTIYDRLKPALAAAMGGAAEELPRLMPIGRLDLNTEGLLLLTNDGEFKRQLELPATGIERTYRARVFGEVSQEQLEELIHGIEIEGIRYGSIDANMERRTGRNFWVEMRLKEGKNREIRRVLEHLGLQVSRLIRIAYGPFVLGDLPSGQVGEIRQHELVEFRKSLR